MNNVKNFEVFGLKKKRKERNNKTKNMFLNYRN